MTAKIIFHEEVQLAGWSDSHTSGAKTTFWHPDPGHLDLFRGMTERKGKTAGQRFYMTLVEINDDETVDAEPTEAAHNKPGAIATLAYRWCRDPEFLAWAGHNWPHADESSPLTQEECRMLLLDVCKIGSRRELDTVPAAADTFMNEFRTPFMAYLESKS